MNQRINLRRLRYFHTVVSAGSLKDAARQLGVSPSTLSEQISQLESDLGTRLFSRRSIGLRPNDAGRALYESTLTIFESVSRIERQFYGADDAERVFRLGHSISVPLIHEGLVFARIFQHEDIRIKARTGSSEQLMTCVRRGELDAAVIDRPLMGGEEETYASTSIGKAPLVVAAHKKHAAQLASRGLAGVPYIACSRTNYIFGAVKSYLDELGMSPDNQIADINDPNLALRCARFNECVVVLPRFAFALEQSEYQIISESKNKYFETFLTWAEQSRHPLTESVADWLRV